MAQTLPLIIPRPLGRMRAMLLSVLLLCGILIPGQSRLWAQQDGNPSITIRTSKEIGDEINLKIAPVKLTSWQWASISIEGVAEPAEKGSKTYTLTSQTITITGRVQELVCFNVQLTEIDIKESPELTSLWVNYNQLQSLDLSGCPNLASLSCISNELKELDLSPCPALSIVTCQKNKLKSVRTDGASELSELVCYNNEITSLNFAQNPKIHNIVAYHNQIDAEMSAFIRSLPELPLYTEHQLLLVDIGKDGNMCYKSDVALALERGWTVQAYDNGVKIDYPGLDEARFVTMRVKPDRVGQRLMLNIAAEGALSAEGLEGEITVGRNSYLITGEEIVINGNITTLECGLSGLTELDVTRLNFLEQLDCSFNELTNLDISKNLHLKGLDVMGNHLKTLELGKKDELEWLNCALNELTTLNLTDCAVISQIACYLNNINENNFSWLLKNLPHRKLSDHGEIFFIETTSESHSERNQYSNENILYANSIGWRVYDYQRGKREELLPENPIIGEGVMTLTFDATPGEVIPLEITCDGAFEIEGLDGKPSDGYAEYTLVSPEVTIRGDVKNFRCFNSSLTKMDASQNDSLRLLHAFDTGLKMLNVSQNANLKRIIVKGCQLEQLTFGNNPKIESIATHTNKLTSLRLPDEAPLLTYVDCFRNKLNEQAMGEVIKALPNLKAQNKTGMILLFDSKSKKADENRCTPEQVAMAQSKGWNPIDYIGGENGENGKPYEGWTSIIEVEHSQARITSDHAQGQIEIHEALPGTLVTLYTLQGAQIYTATCDDSGELSIPMESLPDGHYLLQVGTITTRIFWF